MVLAAHRKGEARDGIDPCGPLLVQLRLATGLTSKEYVKQKAWQRASLGRCPNHESGGCGFARHTMYERVEPPGAFIARYYCPESHTTFSLLPDCLASHLSSTLAEVELIAEKVARTDVSVETVAAQLRPDIEQQGAVRWVRRRVTAVLVALLALKGLRPDVLAGREPTLEDFRAALGVKHVLPALRELAGEQATALPCPVGLCPRARVTDRGRVPRQQGTGADPP